MRNPWARENGPEPFDKAELLRRCLGNEDLLRNLVGRFTERIVAELCEASSLGDGDTRKLAAFAHRLKGLAANLAAHPLERRAAELERLALDHDGARIALCMKELVLEVERFKDAAAAVLREEERIPAA